MSTGQGKILVDQLVDFNVPVLLFSGGEPLMREDIFTIADYAVERGIRPVISTNGTLITEARAKALKKSGFAYVGISLDGIGDVNDRFRGKKGAFEEALKGFRACTSIGLKVGLRFVLTNRNVDDIDRIFDFIDAEGVNRACFYHLVPAGRGENMKDDLLPPEVAQKAMYKIMDRAMEFHKRGEAKDILTVDNHCDGIAIYLRLLKENPERAKEVLSLLEWNGGGTYSTGVGIGCVDWFGNVHPDQFWRNEILGNVRDRSFGDIWMDRSNPLMDGLKDRLPLLKGKCGSCRFKKACGGSLRVRAQKIYGDPWAEDPACYIPVEDTREV
jgi:radical SAM protein with 4Fe4S-binding SPASM domain